jgi:glutathione S-transferase
MPDSRPPYRVISHRLCPYVQRAIIVLIEKDLDFERVDIDLEDKPDWFAALSPLGRVPVLEVGDTVLFESQVIAEYLDEATPGRLHPEDPLERARHRAWIEYGSETLGAVYELTRAGDEATFATRRDAVAGKLARVEREVAGPFFAGETFHLIDAVWATVLRYFAAIDAAYPTGLVTGDKLETWRSAVLARPSVAAAVPEGYAAELRASIARRGVFLSPHMAA